MDERAGGIEIGLRHGEIRLHDAAFDEAAATALPLLGHRQRLQIIKRTQRIAAGHRRDAECQQAEGGEAI